VIRRNLGLFCYAVGVAIPLAYAILAKWYLGMWGFSFPLDALGWVVTLLVTLPFWASALIIGWLLRRQPTQPSDKRVS
jgi:hypothetical protein